MVWLEWAQTDGAQDYNGMQSIIMLLLTCGAKGQHLLEMRVRDTRASWGVDGLSDEVCSSFSCPVSGIVLPTFLEFDDVLFYAFFFCNFNPNKTPN